MHTLYLSTPYGNILVRARSSERCFAPIIHTCID